MHLQTDCSSCEHQSWESNWLSKLERAATFLARLSENGCSGTGEITALVQELNETYQKASWDVQHMTSFASKKSVARVNVTHHKTSPSPLSQEVRPEDVVELQREKQWEEIQDEDYDGNYVASTDPIHPVSTDYTHPWDNDDSSWVSNYFSPEEMQVPDDQPTIDLEASAWTWDTNGTEENPASTNATSQKIYPDDCSSQWRTTDTDTQLKAWAPEADATKSAGDITLNGNFTTTTTTTTAAAAKEKPEKEHMEKVMAEIWSVVNNTTPDVNPRQPTQHTGENPTTSLLENLHLSSLRPTTTTPPPLPPSPNSTRAT